MKFRKLGNNLAARIQSNLVNALNFRARDSMELTPKKTRGIRRPKIDNFFAKLDALAKLPSNFVFDRDDTNVR